MADERQDFDDKRTTEKASAISAPVSSPSTWAGAYVLMAVGGILLIRRSLRRFN